MRWAGFSLPLYMGIIGGNSTISGMTGPTKQHAECVFRGHVQGVGFRYTTVHIARGHDVAGHVCNMPDGSVQLVVEGAPDVIARFIAEIEQRMGRYIRDREITYSDHIVGHDGFDIEF